ncbi:MAG: flagellar basal body P-ring formation chaperone FlgA, partial [Pedobacter sp.]
TSGAIFLRNLDKPKHLLMFMRIITITIFCFILMSGLVMGLSLPPAFSTRDAEIRDAVTAYIQQKTAGLGWEVRIKPFFINKGPVLPEGPLEYEVVAPQQWEGWGGVNLTVLARQGNRVVRNSSMRVEVEALSDMVVTLRQLDHGTIITSKDIAVQKRDIAAVGGKFSRSMDDMVGKRTRITIKANAAVQADQVEKVPLITSGQMVTIVAENEIMKVTVAGRARNAGAEGDTIIVQNLNSLKDIPARVINATTVQVAF